MNPVVQMELSHEQAEAAQKYAEQTERAQVHRSAEKRVMAGEQLRKAKALLTPQQVAILDMVLIKGRTIAQLAQSTGRPAADLEALFLQSCDRLAQRPEPRPPG